MKIIVTIKQTKEGVNEMKTVLKKTIAILLSVMMMLGTTGGVVFAGGPDDLTCICESKCTEESVNVLCPVCGKEQADLSICLGKEAEKRDGTETKQIFDWQWEDNNGFLNGNILALPGVNEDNPIDFEEIVSLLPKSIIATIEGQEETELLSISWLSDGFTDGAIEGSYIFEVKLPEGYVLTKDAEEMAVQVELGGVQMMPVRNSSIEKFEVNGTDILTAMNNQVDCGDGTATFDPDKNILTLENATITNGANYGINIEISDETELTILLVGENNIQNPYFGIRQYGGNLIIKGSGKLTVHSDSRNGIASFARQTIGGNITIEECTLDIQTDAMNQNTTALSADKQLQITNTNVSVISAQNSAVSANRIIVTDSELYAKNSENSTSTTVINITSKNGMMIKGSHVTVESLAQEKVDYPGAAVSMEGLLEISDGSEVDVMTKTGNGILADKITITGEETVVDVQTEDAYPAVSADSLSTEGVLIISDGADVTVSSKGFVYGIYVGTGMEEYKEQNEIQIKNGAKLTVNTEEGAGIYCYGGTISIEDSFIRMNTLAEYSAIIGEKSTTISGSWAEIYGGTLTQDTEVTNSVVFQDGDGEVKGDYVLPCDITMSDDLELDIMDGNTITIPASFTFINQGKIESINGALNNSGQIDNYGTITNSGTITNNNIIRNLGTITNNSIIRNMATTLSNGSLTLRVGSSESLLNNISFAEVIESTGHEIIGNPVTLETLTWNSDDENIAVVEDGVVTAKGVGETNISAIAQNGEKAVYTINVMKKSSSGGGSPSYYFVTFDTNDGEDMDKLLKVEYSEISLEDYVPEKEGYKFVGWYADEDLTKKIDEVYLTQDTTVYAKWEKIEEEVSEEPDETEEIKEPETISFLDVKESDWFYEAVSYAVENGLMSGMSEDIFAPNTPLTREMLAVILWNLEGNPTPNEVAPFLDVTSDKYYANAIAWANENGIVAGYGDTFGVGDSITREQFAVMLYNYAQYQGYDVSVGEDTNILSYTDAFDISNYAYPAMQWACGAGIINGMGDGTLAPQGQTTRAETATILMNFCENVVK